MAGMDLQGGQVDGLFSLSRVPPLQEVLLHLQQHTQLDTDSAGGGNDPETLERCNDTVNKPTYSYSSVGLCLQDSAREW